MAQRIPPSSVGGLSKITRSQPFTRIFTRGRFLTKIPHSRRAPDDKADQLREQRHAAHRYRWSYPKGTSWRLVRRRNRRHLTLGRTCECLIRNPNSAPKVLRPRTLLDRHENQSLSLLLDHHFVRVQPITTRDPHGLRLPTHEHRCPLLYIVDRIYMAPHPHLVKKSLGHTRAPWGPGCNQDGPKLVGGSRSSRRPQLARKLFARSIPAGPCFFLRQWARTKMNPRPMPIGLCFLNYDQDGAGSNAFTANRFIFAIERGN